LNTAIHCESFLHEFLGESVGDAAAVDGAICGGGLVVNIVEGEGFLVSCGGRESLGLGWLVKESMDT